MVQFVEWSIRHDIGTWRIVHVSKRKNEKLCLRFRISGIVRGFANKEAFLFLLGVGKCSISQFHINNIPPQIAMMSNVDISRIDLLSVDLLDTMSLKIKIH